MGPGVFVCQKRSAREVKWVVTCGNRVGGIFTFCMTIRERRRYDGYWYDQIACLSAVVHKQPVKLVECIIVLVSAKAKKGNSIYQLNCSWNKLVQTRCLWVVLICYINNNNTLTMIYKCQFNTIYPGRLTNSPIVKASPLFNSVITVWIFIVHVLGPGCFHARRYWGGLGFSWEDQLKSFE